MVSPSRTVQVPDVSLKDESPFIHHGKIDPQRHRTVMIVDDELTGRLILSKVVQQVADDITVVDFDNAIDALTWLDDHQVDLIITDYKMPDMDGIHFIKAVRRKPNNRAVPMMMITVVSEKAVRYDALDAGVTAFLTRPIDQIECRTSCQARKMVMAEIEQIIAQAQLAAQGGAIDPMAAQRQIAEVQQNMQDPAQMEQLISMQMEKIMAEILPGLLPTGNDPMNDPLVQIRMQELALKQQDLQRKTEDDQGQMLLELQKMQQRAATDAARIESQEEIAENRNEVNRERIEVQRQASERRNAS